MLKTFGVSALTIEELGEKINTKLENLQRDKSVVLVGDIKIMSGYNPHEELRALVVADARSHMV